MGSAGGATTGNFGMLAVTELHRRQVLAVEPQRGQTGPTAVLVPEGGWFVLECARFVNGPGVLLLGRRGFARESGR